MPEIAPNKHGVLQMMMLRLDAVLSRHNSLVWFGSVRFWSTQSALQLSGPEGSGVLVLSRLHELTQSSQTPEVFSFIDFFYVFIYCTCCGFGLIQLCTWDPWVKNGLVRMSLIMQNLLWKKKQKLYVICIDICISWHVIREIFWNCRNVCMKRRGYQIKTWNVIGWIECLANRLIYISIWQYIILPVGLCGDMGTNGRMWHHKLLSSLYALVNEAKKKKKEEA